MGYGLKIELNTDINCGVCQKPSNIPTVGALEGLLKSVYWKPAFNKLFQKPTYTLKDIARKSEKELIIKWLTVLK